MIVVAVIALIAIAVLAVLRARADRVPRLGLEPPSCVHGRPDGRAGPRRPPARRLPGATSTTLHDASRGWWPKSQRLPVDDAYTAWFNANSRCGEALRAWLAAAPAARPGAYRAYLAELELEEAAAAELEWHAVALAA